MIRQPVSQAPIAHNAFPVGVNQVCLFVPPSLVKEIAVYACFFCSGRPTDFSLPCRFLDFGPDSIAETVKVKCV